MAASVTDLTKAKQFVPITDYNDFSVALNPSHIPNLGIATHAHGGAMCLVNSELKIEKEGDTPPVVKFIQNVATGNGGGVYIEPGHCQEYRQDNNVVFAQKVEELHGLPNQKCSDQKSMCNDPQAVKDGIRMDCPRTCFECGNKLVDWWLEIQPKVIAASADAAVIQVRNEWTFTIAPQDITESVGTTVVQGPFSGRLKTALAGTTTEIVITAFAGQHFVTTNDLVFNKNQLTKIGTETVDRDHLFSATNSNVAHGTLQTALLGSATTTSVTIRAAAGVSFDDALQVYLQEDGMYHGQEISSVPCSNAQACEKICREDEFILAAEKATICTKVGCTNGQCTVALQIVTGSTTDVSCINTQACDTRCKEDSSMSAADKVTFCPKRLCADGKCVLTEEVAVTAATITTPSIDYAFTLGTGDVQWLQNKALQGTGGAIALAACDSNFGQACTMTIANSGTSIKTNQNFAVVAGGALFMGMGWNLNVASGAHIEMNRNWVDVWAFDSGTPYGGHGGALCLVQANLNVAGKGTTLTASYNRATEIGKLPILFSRISSVSVLRVDHFVYSGIILY